MPLFFVCYVNSYLCGLYKLRLFVFSYFERTSILLQTYRYKKEQDLSRRNVVTIKLRETELHIEITVELFLTLLVKEPRYVRL